MLLDMVEIIYEAGYRVLPQSQLREGWVRMRTAGNRVFDVYITDEK